MDDSRIEYTKSKFTELEAFYNSLIQDNETIILESQELDNRLQDILHYMELKKFNVPEGYFAILDLQNILKRKRINIECKKEVLELLLFFDGKRGFVETNKTVKAIRCNSEQADLKILDKVNSLTIKSCQASYDYLFSQNVNESSYAIVLAEMIKGYNDRRDELKLAMSTLEKKLNSLLLKIEFSKFGLIEGYNYATTLRDLRIERRRVKDEFDRFKYLDAVLLNNEKIVPTVERVEKQEELKNNRKYTPRVLKSYGIMTS